MKSTDALYTNLATKNVEKSHDNSPLLSILCITYNHEKYIGQALDSFLAQRTTFPIEIVIGEDNSHDATMSVINQYKIKYPGLFKIVTSPANVGVVENFRRTLKECSGKYIAICEGDDYWTDDQKLQKQVEFLENNPEFVITYHDAHAFNEVGILKEAQLPAKFQCDADANDLLNARQISTLTVCFRKVLPEIPFEFDQAPILDLCLWSLLGSFGKGKYLKSVKPAAYRIHQGGVISSQNRDNKIRMTMHTYLCLARYYARTGNAKLSQKFTFKTILLGNSQLGKAYRIRLILTEIDIIFGGPLNFFKQLISSISLRNR